MSELVHVMQGTVTCQYTFVQYTVQQTYMLHWVVGPHPYTPSVLACSIWLSTCGDSLYDMCMSFEDLCFITNMLLEDLYVVQQYILCNIICRLTDMWFKKLHVV